MSIREAFLDICKDAKPADSHYVTLYVDVPFYGGPEEGGWWGADTSMVAYYEVTSMEEAELVRTRVLGLAEKLTKDARDGFNRQCAAECEWLESRGLDADYLPEVDGEDRYYVAVEEQPGSHVHEGDRYYS